MDDRIEKQTFFFVGENDRSEFWTIEASICIQDRISECLDDTLQADRSRFDDIASDLIGIQHGASELAKDIADTRFPYRDRTCQTNFHHYSIYEKQEHDVV